MQKFKETRKILNTFRKKIRLSMFPERYLFFVCQYLPRKTAFDELSCDKLFDNENNLQRVCCQRGLPVRGQKLLNIRSKGSAASTNTSATKKDEELANDTHKLIIGNFQTCKIYSILWIKYGKLIFFIGN